MNIKVIASSSKGNSYILKGKRDVLLIECGVPFKAIKKGVDFNLSNVCGCLISHAHL